MSYEEILNLIHQIDHYHGNALKDRSRASIDSEVKFIQHYLNARKAK